MPSATAMSPKTATSPDQPAAHAIIGADIAALSFEDALAELEKIVRALEGGQQKL
jgi:exodeoxyribonuclease VII small subunit